MCFKLVLFRLVLSCFVYGVESNLVLKDYSTVGKLTISHFYSNMLVKIEDHNLSYPLIPMSQQETSELGHMSTTNFDFMEICQATLFVSDRHVSVIALDSEFLELKNVYSIKGLVTWYTLTDNLEFSQNVIIVVKSLKQFHKLLNTKRLWHQESIYVIVLLECSHDVKVEMETLWQFHNMYKYVLVCGEHKPLLYMYQPYIHDERSKIYEITDITEIKNIMVHAVDNLYGLQLRVVLFPHIPTSIIDRDGKFIGGAEYFSLQVLQQRMNFSSVIHPPTDGQTFPRPGKKLSGSVKDLASGKADMAFNGHFLQNYGIDELKMTRYVYMDKLCFVVPMPSFKSHYTVMIHIFPKLVWCLLITVYCLTIYVYYIVLKLSQTTQNKQRLEDLFLQVYAIFITGASTLKTNRSSQKLLIGVVLLGVFILSNIFQGLLTTGLSRPIRNPYIDTIDQVTKSKLALQFQHAETLVEDPDMLQILKALRQRKPTATNFIRLARFPVTHFEKYYTYLSYWPQENITEHLHTVQECIKSNYLSYVLPQNSPFVDRINDYVLKFQESGLFAKWFGDKSLLRKSFWPVENERTVEIPPKPFAVNDLKAIFYLLVYGHTISTIVFITENFVGRFILLKHLCKK